MPGSQPFHDPNNPKGITLRYGGYEWIHRGITTSGYVWETRVEDCSLRLYAKMMLGGPTGLLWLDTHKLEVYAYHNGKPLFMVEMI